MIIMAVIIIIDIIFIIYVIVIIIIIIIIIIMIITRFNFIFHVVRNNFKNLTLSRLVFLNYKITREGALVPTSYR